MGCDERGRLMARRVCAEPGCPIVTDTTRCPTHTRERDKARGTTTQRGYGSAHQREAKAWQRKVATGARILCWRCNEPITDPTDVHLGHDDNDRSVTRGPEHGRACNLSAAGRISPRG